MAKFKEKIKAQKLREQGRSIKEIAKTLKVSKGSVSIWCRDIKLTKKQIARLDKKQLKRGYTGRLKGARMQRERHLRNVEQFNNKGFKRVGKLNKRDLLIAGIALYWGEGDKKNNCVRISNSDPEMVRFILNWYKIIWGISKQDIKLHIGINYIHKKRINIVEKYWSKLTGITRTQFGKTVLIKAKNKKIYHNFNVHYGTLSIRVNKSSLFKYQLDGMMKAITKY